LSNPAGFLRAWIGKGRLASPDDIVDAADLLLSRASLLGRLVLVTAGPTYEDIDPSGTSAIDRREDG